MSRLILSVDDAVMKRAKRYARAHGLSLSELVEQYLDSVTRDADCPFSAQSAEF
jgi:antitoxin component of RelBE/YafQ-DinJ toxin-antitoxin module